VSDPVRLRALLGEITGVLDENTRLAAEIEALTRQWEGRNEVMLLCTGQRVRVNGGHLMPMDGGPCVVCGPGRTT
jgi:hypothetical protein